MEFPNLHKAVYSQPAIDNHAHPLLREETRDRLAFEGVISEAQDEALIHDAPNTLACLRATKQLAMIYNLPYDASWEDVKIHRASMDYEALCKTCFKAAGIHSILMDDGLGGSAEMAHDYRWHDQLTSGGTKRIVRVEVEAEEILKGCANRYSNASSISCLKAFEAELRDCLIRSGDNLEVVGFKSIVCYRTGMNVSANGDNQEKMDALKDVLEAYKQTGAIRLAHKALNDEVVRITLAVAEKCGKPVQFHTGLGDNDITLSLSSPAHLQPIIKAYPKTLFVLLHSSYPYTREAGYLTAVYHNVYLDFGEVFPFVSADGQRDIIRQVLELCPTNKIMWSSDGHWWPESYYLGISQARQALYKVLSESVRRDELNEAEAITIVSGALHENASKLYKL